MEYRNKTLFDPGSLRTWVTFYRRTIKKDKDGYESVERAKILRTKVKWANARGAYENLFAKEIVDETSARLSIPAKITLRWSDKIRETDELEKDGLIYEILAVNNIDDRRRFMRIDARRVERGN